MFLYITQQNDRAYTLEKNEVGFFHFDGMLNLTNNNLQSKDN